MLERAPRVVTLWFGEALAPTLSAARLVDEDGNPVRWNPIDGRGR